jgi:hypothetical protein
MHVTLTQDQLLAFAKYIQSINTGQPTEEFVSVFVQRLHTAQMQTFSQAMQEFQLGQKPSASIDLAEDEPDDPNVRIEEGDNKWPYAKPAAYVVHEVQTEETLDRKPHHRGKRGGRKSKKGQGQDSIVTPADSNIGTANETSALSNNVKETVEEESSLVEVKDIIVTLDVADLRKGEASAIVSNTETAGIQKKKRNRHKPKPPKNGAAFVDYFLDRWIESLGSAATRTSSAQQDTGETALLAMRSASQTHCEGNSHSN